MIQHIYQQILPLHCMWSSFVLPLHMVLLVQQLQFLSFCHMIPLSFSIIALSFSLFPPSLLSLLLLVLFSAASKLLFQHNL